MGGGDGKHHQHNRHHHQPTPRYRYLCGRAARSLARQSALPFSAFSPCFLELHSTRALLHIMSAPEPSVPYVRKAANAEGLSEGAPSPAPAAVPPHVTNEIVPPYEPHSGERSQCVLSTFPFPFAVWRYSFSLASAGTCVTSSWASTTVSCPCSSSSLE